MSWLSPSSPTAESSPLRIWNASTGDCERILSGHQGALSILPDGRIVSSSDAKTLRVWNASTGDCERFLSGHEGSVRALSILPDGRIVSGSWDTTLRIWNASSGDCEQILSGHEGWVYEVVALSDGRLLSEDCYGNCLLWSPAEEGEGGGFRSESVSKGEYSRLKEGVASSNGGVVGRVSPGYSVINNCVQSESFGRVFVDEVVWWVVKSGDVIAVFEKKNGRDHWFREVSG
jgi:WD40 repeat protein